jgi:hypothetical protein
MDFTSTPPAWQERVGAFATSVSKNPEDITAALETLVGEPSDEAVSILSDPTSLADEDLKNLLVLGELKIPLGVFNKHVSKLRGEAGKAESSSGTSKNGVQLSILPTVPDEESFMQMLRTGGVLKVEKTEVLSAVKAAFAKRVGLYELPQLILEKMEAFALRQEEPSGEDFYEMQRLLTEKKYGDILTVLKVPGAYVNESRKKEFFAKVDQRLWPALSGFQTQLNAWQQAWMQGATGTGVMMMAMASKSNNALAAGMMAPPDTSPLHTSAEEVVNEINRIFAGPGIPVARALAYDATRIMTILKKETLPAQIGAATKEQMLKDLGVNVGSDMIRIEQAVTRFTLAIMSLSKVVGDEEAMYLMALTQLGATIPWDNLGGKGIGTRL